MLRRYPGGRLGCEAARPCHASGAEPRLTLDGQPWPTAHAAEGIRHGPDAATPRVDPRCLFRDVRDVRNAPQSTQVPRSSPVNHRSRPPPRARRSVRSAAWAINRPTTAASAAGPPYRADDLGSGPGLAIPPRAASLSVGTTDFRASGRSVRPADGDPSSCSAMPAGEFVPWLNSPICERQLRDSARQLRDGGGVQISRQPKPRRSRCPRSPAGEGERDGEAPAGDAGPRGRFGCGSGRM